MCQSIILSTNGTTSVSYCQHCGNCYIWHQTFLLTFDTEQYGCFWNVIKEKMGVEEFFRFPDGIARIVLNTPVREIVFTFTHEEWIDFTKSMNEGFYMRQIHEMIHPN
ncbi:hypothetical protein [Sphingobacterium paludis]|jgi:hypothetical protein|uniref:Uncharacterized protein n=1 Tax=Sphingobacterium paludis TaxID=1476465 RepID=A0A4R7D3D5_9SPHI|nr:hypothetical protein [Sphingobacterium paludis]TDS14631.1 hypothetical protein B0I21_103126 [Sphingobacterium paludis]